MLAKTFLCATGLVTLFTFQVRADSLKEVNITFTAQTSDVHVRMAGTPMGDPRPANLMNVPPAVDQANTAGAYDAGWTAPPGAGTYKFTFKRNGNGDWSFRYILTTDGSRTFPFDESKATKVASLSIGIVPGGTAIFADNSAGTQDVNISNVSATVVTGLGSFDPEDWDTATGTTFSLAGLVVPAGDSGILLGTIGTLAADQWIRLNYNADGVPGQDGYDIVPEPGTIGLLLCGLCGVAYLPVSRSAKFRSS
jgi:hypothetical protein